jgi:hypothetical protein
MKTLYTLFGALALAASLHGQAAKPAAPAAPAPVPAAPTKEIVLTATAANVKEKGMPVTIRLFRWSTEEERTPLITAFAARVPATGRQGRGSPGTPAASGQGQPQRTQDQAPAGQSQDQDDQTQGQDSDEPAQARPQDQAQGRDGQPAQGRGQAQPTQGRGQGQAGPAQGQAGGRGRGAQAPLTAVSPMTQALQKAPTIGYLWTNEPTGYSVKHAWRTSQPDGSERVVVITEPRLGAYSPAWTVSTGTPTDYAYTLIEFRLNTRSGEGKSSLTSNIVADPTTKQLALENYAAAPAILTNVRMAAK